jgi:hypothetical protein
LYSRNKDYDDGLEYRDPVGAVENAAGFLENKKTSEEGNGKQQSWFF